jgi:hypothetical protein
VSHWGRRLRSSLRGAGHTVLPSQLLGFPLFSAALPAYAGALCWERAKSVSRIGRSPPGRHFAPMFVAGLPAGHPASSARHPPLLPLPSALQEAGPTPEMRSKTIDVSPYRLPQSCAGRSRNLSILPCEDARDGCRDLEMITEKRACHPILSVSSEKSAEMPRNNEAARWGIGILSTDYVTTDQ